MMKQETSLVIIIIDIKKILRYYKYCDLIIEYKSFVWLFMGRDLIIFLFSIDKNSLENVRFDES